MWSLTLLTNSSIGSRKGKEGAAVSRIKALSREMGCFLPALWGKQVQLRMLSICACIHSPSSMGTFRFLVEFRQFRTHRCYLPESFMETESERDKEDCNTAFARHQHNLTLLRHQIIHMGRKHYKFHKRMKIFNLLFIWENPTISGIKDFSHEL